MHLRQDRAGRAEPRRYRAGSDGVAGGPHWRSLHRFRTAPGGAQVAESSGGGGTGWTGGRAMIGTDRRVGLLYGRGLLEVALPASAEVTVIRKPALPKLR